MFGPDALRTPAVAALGALAVLSLALGFLPLGRGHVSVRWRVVGITLTALALRAAFSLVNDGGTYDIFNAYRGLGDELRQGGDVFSPATLSLANYPPVVYWWWAAAAQLVPSGNDHLFAAIVRAPFWITDACIPAVILLFSDRRWGGRAAWLYAINPITVAACTLHGQFDCLPALALLGGVMAFTRARFTTAAVLTGVGGGLKSWPLYFIPHALARLPSRMWLRYVAMAASVPAAAFALYAVLRPQHILQGMREVLAYSPHRQGFGSSRLLPDDVWPGAVVAVNTATGLLIVGWVIWSRKRDVTLFESVAISMLLLLGLSPTVSDQYLVWPIAFLLVAGRLRTLAILSAVTTPAIAFLDLWVAENWVPTPTWILAPVRLTFVGAALLMLRSVARRPPAPDEALAAA